MILLLLACGSPSPPDRGEPPDAVVASTSQFGDLFLWCATNRSDHPVSIVAYTLVARPYTLTTLSLNTAFQEEVAPGRQVVTVGTVRAPEDRLALMGESAQLPGGVTALESGEEICGAIPLGRRRGEEYDTDGLHGPVPPERATPGSRWEFRIPWLPTHPDLSANDVYTLRDADTDRTYVVLNPYTLGMEVRVAVAPELIWK